MTLQLILFVGSENLHLGRSAGDTAIGLHAPVPFRVLREEFQFGWGGVGGILGKLRAKVPRSSMRSLSGGGGGALFLGVILSQEKGILWDFDNKIITLGLVIAPQIVSHTQRSWRLIHEYFDKHKAFVETNT